MKMLATAMSLVFSGFCIGAESKDLNFKCKFESTAGFQGGYNKDWSGFVKKENEDGLYTIIKRRNDKWSANIQDDSLGDAENKEIEKATAQTCNFNAALQVVECNSIASVMIFSEHDSKIQLAKMIGFIKPAGINKRQEMLLQNSQPSISIGYCKPQGRNPQ